MENTAQKITDIIKSKTLEAAFYARSGLYFLEGLPLIFADQWIQSGKIKRPTKELPDKQLFEEVSLLVKNDIKNITDGVYDLSVLRLEKPLTHVRNLVSVYFDSISVSKNKKNKKTKVFSDTALEKMKDLPDYYKRNFHYQTDGYLSEKSAAIYDHQVEILFRGTADIMRRLILGPIIKKFGSDKRLQIFEVGCGTGVSTYPLIQTFKKSRIKAVDLSKDYVEFCKKEYSSNKRVSFDVAAGEDLSSIKDNSQDIWCSTFVFHELPYEVRLQTLKEAYRVLKPGGGIFLVDSIQHHDRPDFKNIMDLFPQNFHEPFYKNYVSKPLENLFEVAGFTDVKSESGFVSKVCWATKE